MSNIKNCMKTCLIDTRLYIYTATLVFMLDEILIVHTYIGDFLKLFIAWGFLIITANVWVEKKTIKGCINKYSVFLMLFVISYVITIFVNRESFVTENIKLWAYMLAFFAVLYVLKRKEDRVQWKREMCRFANYIVILTFILTLICLLTYVFSINILIKETDGYSHIGMYDNRLWGLYNPNVGSTLNVISVIFSLGLFYETEKERKMKRVFLALNLVFQYVNLLLTGSRTSLLTLVLGVMLSLFFVLRDKRRVGVRVLVCVFSAVLLLGAYNPVKVGLSYVPGTVKQYIDVTKAFQSKQSGKKQSNPEGKKKVDLKRKETEENRSGGFLTGRQYLWEAGVKALKEHPLFGISKAATYDKAKVYIEDDFWLLSLESSLHNTYITVLVASGIVGFILFMLFLVLNIKDYLKITFVWMKSETNQTYIALLIVIAMMMITECLEGRIVYRTEVFNVLFWSLMGYASQYTRIIEREEKDGKVIRETQN